MTQATARAHANIALAKYWGKADVAQNLPAVPSVSMTLAPLRTETTVRFDDALAADELELDGAPAKQAELARVTALLDRVRAEAGLNARAHVASGNDFPTASGLASSASGFCALAAAARAAAGLAFDREAISRLSRAASVSAARSAFEGFVELPLGDSDELSARALAAADHWPLRIVVAVTAEGRKQVGSTSGMQLTAKTSPYYAAWVLAAPRLAGEVREGIVQRDLERVGRAMEQSTLAMHACAMAADPGILYFLPATLAAFACVRDLRERQGLGVWATMDAGPHVKALCHADDAPTVAAALRDTAGVLRIIEAQPGAGVELVR